MQVDDIYEIQWLLYSPNPPICFCSDSSQRQSLDKSHLYAQHYLLATFFGHNGGARRIIYARCFVSYGPKVFWSSVQRVLQVQPLLSIVRKISGHTTRSCISNSFCRSKSQTMVEIHSFHYRKAHLHGLEVTAQKNVYERRLLR